MEHSALAPSTLRSRKHAARGNYFLRHWRGQLGLGVSYWINGVLLSNVAPLLLGVAIGSVEASTSGTLRVLATLSLGAAALLVLFNVWSSVGILRSASNHPERGGRMLWAGLAYLMVALSLVGVGLKLLHPRALAGWADLLQIAQGHDTIAPVTATVSADGKSVLLAGTLGSGSTQIVQQALAGAPAVHTVQLDSGGGRLFEGQAIAEEVRKRGLDTFAEGECSSACTLVLLAGVERGSSREPRIGFHRASRPGPDGSGAAGTREMVNAYRAAGLGAAFIERIKATPSTSIWYPTFDELVDNRVITQAAPPVEVAPRKRAAVHGATHR